MLVLWFVYICVCMFCTCECSIYAGAIHIYAIIAFAIRILNCVDKMRDEVGEEEEGEEKKKWKQPADGECEYEPYDIGCGKKEGQKVTNEQFVLMFCAFLLNFYAQFIPSDIMKYCAFSMSMCVCVACAAVIFCHNFTFHVYKLVAYLMPH